MEIDKRIAKTALMAKIDQESMGQEATSLAHQTKGISGMCP